MKYFFEYEIVDGQALVKKYTGGDSLTEIVIPDEFENCPVTEIGDEAFEDDRYACALIDEACGDPPRAYSVIKKITIPDTVRIIGEAAFEGLARIEQIKLPSSLEMIGDDAFAFWANWGTMYIPDGVREIGSRAFGNPLFRDVYIPPSAIEIAEDAFYESLGCGPTWYYIRIHLSPEAPPEQVRVFLRGYKHGEFEILYDYDKYDEEV